MSRAWEEVTVKVLLELDWFQRNSGLQRFIPPYWDIVLFQLLEESLSNLLAQEYIRWDMVIHISNPRSLVD